MRFTKWLKEGYTGAIKKLWEAHKWVFHKSLWGTIFIFPYFVGEVLIIYLIGSFIWSLFFGSPEPSMPLIIDN